MNDLEQDVGRDLEPLPDDMEALLGRERGRGGPSPAQAAHLSRRLLALVSAPPVAPVTPPSSTPAPTTPAPTTPAPTTPAPTTQAAATQALTAARLVQFLAVFALGAGAGAGLHAVLAPVPTATVVSASEPARVPTPVFTERDSTLPTVTEREEPTRPPVAPEAAVTPPRVGHEGDGELADSERTADEEATDEQADAARDLALIERARVALGRGQSGDALRALAEHRRRFPRRSDEEREALAVQALAADGQRAEAGVRARAFLARYPRSLFRGVVAPMSREAAPEESETAPSIP